MSLIRKFALVSLVLCLGGLAPGWAAGEGPDSSASSSASSSEPGETTLAEVVAAFEEPERLTQRIDHVFDRTASLMELDEPLGARKEELDALRKRLSVRQEEAGGAEYLLDMQTAILAGSARVDAMVSSLRNGLDDVEGLLAELREGRTDWDRRARLADELKAPAAVHGRIVQLRGSLDRDEQRLRPLRDKLLELLGRAVVLRAQADDIKADLTERRTHMNQALRNSEAAPLWQPSRIGAIHPKQLVAEWRAQLGSVRTYLAAHGVVVLILALVIFGVVRRLTRSARNIPLTGSAQLQPDFQRCARVLEHPGWVALLLTLLYGSVLAPRGPIAFYDLLWLLMPVPAAVLLVAGLGPVIRTTVWAIACALMVSPFRSLLEFAPLIARLVMLAQVLVIAVAIVIDLRRLDDRAGTPRLRAGLRVALGATLAALVVTLFANVTGHVGLASTLRNGVLGTLGVGTVYAAAFYASLGLGLVALRTRFGDLFHLVRRRREAVERALYTVLLVLAGGGTLMGALYGFGVYDLMPDLLGSFMKASIDIGEASLSVGSLVVAVLCLFATWLAMVVVKFLLEDELLPRLNLADGLPFAISALTRYAIGVGGFAFALAAAGIDMTKVTILAGAVGVGVGFGLQNIINNFVSGLILLVERPVHVGDMVEAAGASGVVQHIGIRATTIRTFQGGDVIVPNGDLLAKDLLNWTLSNRRRRVEIDIGAGYGSDPEVVLRILTEAATAHDAVLATPAPLALFVGFGDSSLDFRLQLWVHDVDRALATASDVRRAILERFAAEGLEIPFPQRDVWLRQAPTDGGAEAPAPGGLPQA